MSVLALFSLAAVAAAAAPSDEKFDQNEAAHKFAACIARSAPGEVRGLLMMDTRSPDYTAQLAAVVNGPAQKCKKKAKGLSVGTALFAGMMAEALLRARFQPDVPVDQLAPDPRRQPLPARNAGDSLGLCTVAKAPSASSQLLAALPGSTAESRAIDAIRAAINSCLKPGTRINAGAPALRSMVSLAVWRVVSAEKVR